MSSEVSLRNLLSDSNTNNRTVAKFSPKNEPPFNDFISKKVTNREQKEPKLKDAPESKTTEIKQSTDSSISSSNSLNPKKENNVKKEVKQDFQEPNLAIKSEEHSGGEKSELSVELSGEEAHFIEEDNLGVEEEILLVDQLVLPQLIDEIEEENKQDISDLESYNVNVIAKNQEFDLAIQEGFQDKEQAVISALQLNKGDMSSVSYEVSNQELKAQTASQILEKAANLNLEQNVSINLSDEEQTMLMQMQKSLANTKVASPQAGFSTQDTNQDNTLSLALNSQKVTGSLEPIIVSKEQVVISQVNAAMADEKGEEVIALENSLRNNLAASEEVTKSEKIQIEIAPKLASAVSENNAENAKPVNEKIKLGDNEKNKTAQEVGQVQDQTSASLMQDESAMSFENELSGFTNFVKTDVASSKMEISFDEFVTVNKNASIIKPEQQMTMSLKHAISQGKSEVSISLYPRSLGHVDIKIEFATNSAGQSEVQKVIITSDRASTLRLFENTKVQLETTLAELKKETATTVTETNKKEASLEFEMRNNNGGRGDESYFASSEERENWMNKFQNLTKTDESGEKINEGNINEQTNPRPHYITSTSVNIEV